MPITDTKARNLKPGDRPVSDGTVKGLRLEPGSARGRAKWILRYVSPVTGKRRDMGLGAYPETSIALARGRAASAREHIAAGQDPIDVRTGEAKERARKQDALTFERAARTVHTELAAGWKNAKHSAQWIQTLETYAFPQIGSSRVSDLGPSDFAEVLRPIWLKKPETASRVKQRCHAIMKWCWAQGEVSGNAVDVVDHLLARQPGKRERLQHQPAMPWRQIPEFVRTALHTDANDITRPLLELLILTAARSGEVRAMTWGEVDREGHVWTIPAERMKTKHAHRVPLSARAVEILDTQWKKARLSELEGDMAAVLVFPTVIGKVPSDMILTAFLRRQNAPSSDPDRCATAHGFRSSFRDWASEHGYARDLAERALAHTINNQAEAAYHRTDLLEQRRPMMEAWGQYVTATETSREAIPIRRSA